MSDRPSPPEDSAHPLLLPAGERVCASVQGFVAGVALLIGAANLAVWLGPARELAASHGFMVMRFNTALGITAAALSLALWQVASHRRRAALFAIAFASVAVLIGGLTSLEDLLGLDFGIDQLFVAGTFPGDLANTFIVHPGRMSLNAALSMFFVGLALAGLDWSVPWRSARRIFLAPGFALLAALPAAGGLVGYLLEVRGFTGLLRSANILLHTAVALFLLAHGVLAARPHRPPVSRILSPGTDGLLLRWLLPGSTALLLLLAWAIGKGRAIGLVAPGEGTALMVYGALVLLPSLLVVASRAVARQEAVARSAEAARREGEERFRALAEQLARALHEAERASHAKDNFLATLSHELRTPLTPVLLSAAALRQDERLPPDVRTELAMIERNVSLEGRLIDDLLDLTRIARGKLRLRPERCDIHSLVGHAVEIIREEARASGVEIDLDLAAKRSVFTADPARLQQVLWNVLKNAVKFTPAGGRVFVRTHDSPADPRIVLAISDTGAGFPPETAENLFQPFEQGDAAEFRSGGLGLGLAIARAIVDLHGGVIRGESGGPGCGATFTVELPGAIEPPSGSVAPAVVAGEQPEASARLRLLLVEDHEPTRNVLRKLLQSAGYDVRVAGSVAGALATASTERLDVVISDLGLPDGTGHELMKRLLGLDSTLRGIAISGYGMDEDLRRSEEAGFFTHLVKPVKFEQLREALDRVHAQDEPAFEDDLHGMARGSGV